MNDELEIHRGHSSVLLQKSILEFFWRDWVKPQKTFSQDSQSPGQNSNPGLHEYQASVLTTTPKTYGYIFGENRSAHFINLEFILHNCKFSAYYIPSLCNNYFGTNSYTDTLRLLRDVTGKIYRPLK